MAFEHSWDCRLCPAIVSWNSRYSEGPCGSFCRDGIKIHVKSCVTCAQKFPEAVTPRFGCPKCKSENLSENNIIQVRLPIIAWDEMGKPVEFRSNWREVKNTVRCVAAGEAPHYHCNGCDHDFDEPEPIGPCLPVVTPL